MSSLSLLSFSLLLLLVLVLLPLLVVITLLLSSIVYISLSLDIYIYIHTILIKDVYVYIYIYIYIYGHHWLLRADLLGRSIRGRPMEDLWCYCCLLINISGFFHFSIVIHLISLFSFVYFVITMYVSLLVMVVC